MPTKAHQAGCSAEHPNGVTDGALEVELHGSVEGASDGADEGPLGGLLGRAPDGGLHRSHP